MSADPDTLMKGNYRPLKSALKKPKKPPRQSKNIHHNYFMAMRGFRPALIPFPHGFHPPPIAARHTLWWKNVPKNPDQIMASPAISKMPEEGGSEENEKGAQKPASREKDRVKEVQDSKDASGADSSDSDGKRDESKSKTVRFDTHGGEGVIGEDKVKRSEAVKAKEQAAESEAMVPGVPKSVSAEKERRKEKESEQEKRPAKVEMAKEAAKATAKEQNKSDSCRLGPASAASVTAVQPAPSVPPIQKDILVGHLMLCAGLYLSETIRVQYQEGKLNVVQPQLAYALLCYFIWQFIESSGAFAHSRVISRAPADWVTALYSNIRQHSPSREPELPSDQRRSGTERSLPNHRMDQDGPRSQVAPAKTIASTPKETEDPDTATAPGTIEKILTASDRLTELKADQSRLEEKGKLTEELKLKYEKSLSSSDTISPLSSVTSSKGKEKMTEEMVRQHEGERQNSTGRTSRAGRSAIQEVQGQLKSLQKDQVRRQEEGKMTDELKEKFKRKRKQLEAALVSLQANASRELSPEQMEKTQRAREVGKASVR